MAQISSAYPTAGGLYHWGSILGNRFTGWLWERACSRKRWISHVDAEWTATFASKPAPTVDRVRMADRY
jgi:hypothetical protein